MSLTQQDIDLLDADLSRGDRGAFYLHYYEMIKDTDPEAANQVMIQAHISTYSGFFGGAAILGNAIAKFANPDAYTPC